MKGRNEGWKWRKEIKKMKEGNEVMKEIEKWRKKWGNERWKEWNKKWRAEIMDRNEKNERRKWGNVWKQSKPKGNSTDKSGDSFSHIGL